MMVYCTHGRREALGVEPSLPCASCEKIARDQRDKERKEMADLRAENESLRGMLREAGNILEEVGKRLVKQNGMLAEHKARMLRVLGKQ